ncbi:glycosyltransferase [Halalkalibacter wakoensis JCM 9140]|uniref:Glycosyltransferase n=1 Tax=Halalkalibacter wakoensis JCM 9140 TaxID=1236970 RepID=W4Q229_9BACI|nr:glycosyltransferase [Halalkalibacter wakoensis]GAE25995.1 glycosyltransferase [Halalkalibacter wakoensis JCM 9140]
MISVITSTIRESFMDNVFSNFRNQLYEQKELIVILNKDEMDIDLWQTKCLQDSNIKVFHLPEHQTLGECLNFGIQQANGDYIAKFDDDDFYSPYYLQEAKDTCERVNVPVVGKTSFLTYLHADKNLIEVFPKSENMYTRWIAGGTIFFKKEVSNLVTFPSVNQGEDTGFITSCIENGFPVFSASKYHYVLNRFQENHQHTWKLDNSEFFYAKGDIIAANESYERSLILAENRSI